MEDWAYAGSWENKTSPGIISSCEMQTKNGNFPISELNYSDNAIRSAIYLIETADSKKPSQKFLGDSEGVTNPST